MIGGVLSDALAVYRLLLRRSVVVGGVIFAVVALADAFAERSATQLTTLIYVVLALIGQLLVQGALIEAVRDLHEGRPRAALGTLVDRTRGRLGTLLGVSFVYGIGVLLGLALLIVPGLIALARWSLVVPLVMIEGLGWREAFTRSSDLVRGRTGQVLGVVVVTNLIAFAVGVAIISAFLALPSFFAAWVGGTVAGAVTVPFQAHVLSVLYYRLTEPERPVLPALA